MSLQNFFKIDRIINILIAFGFSVGSAFGSLFQLLSTTNATNCVPGKQIKIECNPCVCNQDGRSYSCTLMNCSPHNVLRRLVTRPASNCKVSGVTFRNDCNNCYCQEPGLALCTNYGCTSCFPLARFWRGCQFCVCNRDGFSMVCTDRYCSTRRERATTCKLGDTIRTEHGVCICDDKGEFSVCTKMSVPACRPDNTVQRECNPWTCDSHSEYSIYKLMIRPKKCKRGEIVQLDCNPCTCHEHGEFSICSRISCPEKCKLGGSIRTGNGVCLCDDKEE